MMRFSPHARFWAESDHSFWSYLPLSDENFTLENLHHNIYRTRIGVCLCYKQQSGIQSCHGACWLPALSNTYRHDRNLPYLPTASRLLPRFSKVLYKVIMSLLLLIHDKAAKVVTSRAFKINIKKTPPPHWKRREVTMFTCKIVPKISEGETTCVGTLKQFTPTLKMIKRSMVERIQKGT